MRSASHSSPRSAAVPAVLLVGVTAVWGWTFVIVKDALAAYSVIPFVALRFTIASAAMTPHAVRKMTRETALIGGGIGVVLAGSYLLQTFGLSLTSPTNCGLITGLFVVSAPLVNRVLFGVKTGPVYWAAVAISLGGLTLLSGTGRTPLNPGDLLVLGCALTFGLHVALLDRHASNHDASALTLGQFWSATAILWVAWVATEPVTAPSGRVWVALCLMGLLATAAAFYIQTYAQQHLSGIRAAVILTMEPVFAAFFGCLLAGDRLTAPQWLGGGLMVGALLLAELRGQIRKALARRSEHGTCSPDGGLGYTASDAGPAGGQEARGVSARKQDGCEGPPGPQE